MNNSVQLGAYISEYNVRNKNKNDLPVFSVTNSQGFCQQYFKKVVASQDQSTYKIVPKNYFAYNPSRINVGSIDWQRNEEQVIVSPLYVVFKTSEQLNNQYLYYYLKSDVALTYIRNLGQGSVRDNLKFSELQKIPLKLYVLEKQERIAKKLDLISVLIEKRKQQLKKFDDLVKSRFIELFGDPINNEKGWEKKSLLQMGTLKNGMNFHSNDKGIQINCLGVGNFKNHSIISDTSLLPKISLIQMPSDEYLLKNEDIVFVRSNGNKALVGRSLIVYPAEIPTTFSGFCIRYRLNINNMDVNYLLYVLKNDGVRQKLLGKGSNIQNLNQHILGMLTIPVPPLELQRYFARFILQVDKSKLAIQKSLDELETLKKSLMQEYFG